MKKAKIKNRYEKTFIRLIRRSTRIDIVGFFLKVLAVFAREFHGFMSFVNSHNLYGFKRHHKLHLLFNFKVLVRYFNALQHAALRLPYQPKISVLIPVYKVKPQYLIEAIKSVEIQTYQNWEICAVDDASQDPEIIKILNDYSTKYPDRFHFSIHEKNQHISHTSNSCLKLASGDYVALLDHDDRLYPNALGEMVRAINLKNQPDILYSDEEVINENGTIVIHPFFKPAFSPNLHLSVNYTTHLSVYRRSLLEEIGGFRPGFEGSQDYDVMLRMVEASKKPVEHVPFCLYQWRAHAESTAAGIESKPYAAIAGEKAIKEALDRRKRPASVNWEPETAHYRIRYDLPSPLPLVSILIPSKNAYELISQCVRSILDKSTYRNFEIIIINHESDDPRCTEFFSKISSQHAEVKVIDVHGPFNFAHFNNVGAEQAKGDFLILLNNDTEVIEPQWIEEMLSLAQWPEIGAVGGKLLFSDNTIQHAGILLFDRRIAGHQGTNREEKDTMYYNMLNTIHETYGVTGACLMIQKSKYLKVGGLDEIWVPNGWGDVHFAIKLREAGFDNVYTPYAKLYHHESPSRGATFEYFEHFYLQSHYGQQLMNDPYLNPNLDRNPDMIPDDIYMGLELYKEFFDFFLTHDKKLWTQDNFEQYLRKIRI